MNSRSPGPGFSFMGSRRKRSSWKGEKLRWFSIIFIEFFHIIYFVHDFFPQPTLLLPIQLYIYFLNKQKQNKNKKHTERKESKIRQKVYKIIIEFILGWSTSLRHGTCPEMWLTYSVRFHWRNR